MASGWEVNRVKEFTQEEAYQEYEEVYKTIESYEPKNFSEHAKEIEKIDRLITLANDESETTV